MDGGVVPQFKGQSLPRPVILEGMTGVTREESRGQKLGHLERSPCAFIYLVTSREGEPTVTCVTMVSRMGLP